MVRHLVAFARSAIRLPHRAAIRSGKRFRAALHIRKATQPDETIGIVRIAKGADDLRAERLLGFQ
jgi:hypothetical protein